MDDIMLGPGERGLMLGMTREGKSTLSEVQIDHWYNTYKDADILIIDSKPRFRAEWQLNGLPAAPLYRNWDWGTLVPNSALKIAYMKRRKRHKLFIYVDELNNFFKVGVKGIQAGTGIIMVITSGGEKNTAFLGAGQRPRNISVESIESMTKLYWFYTPFDEDNKHLRSMDLPLDSIPPASRSYAFLFFDRIHQKKGWARIKPISVKPRDRKGSKGWINYG